MSRPKLLNRLEHLIRLTHLSRLEYLSKMKHLIRSKLLSRLDLLSRLNLLSRPEHLRQVVSCCVLVLVTVVVAAVAKTWEIGFTADAHNVQCTPCTLLQYEQQECYCVAAKKPGYQSNHT